ncbi:hypothetical protein [Tenacibaculum piscium]|uniref:hypothetical protein n=1 Tax=Tenacibaculum piscium TaxID=1458515 RepID=UPI001F29D0B9|nr:hypothetical protein [Tenacibaculum piscium]
MIFDFNAENSSNFLQKHGKIALAYFLIIAFLGVLLRLFAVIDVPINYRFMVHAHSHTALLGWVYTAFTTLIYAMYFKKNELDIRSKKKYQKIFFATQISIIGMLICFPFMGYAFFSILFSTLFLIASYFFGYFIFKHTSPLQKQTNSYKCIRISLWYMMLSSLGPWALGIIIKTEGIGSSLYKNAIYFYLHFQYNGWFILAIFGIFFYILEQNNDYKQDNQQNKKAKITLSKKQFQVFFWMFNSGVFLTFGISLLWMKPSIFVYLISGFGALLQLISFSFLIKNLMVYQQQIKSIFSRFSVVTFQLLKIVVVFLMLKLVFQLIATIPYFSIIIFSNIDFIIGYLHFIFLGIISLSIILFLHQFKLIKLTKKSILFYLIGFFLTEIVIFYKGIIGWLQFDICNYYFEFLVIVSCFLLISIGMIFSSQFKNLFEFYQKKVL